MTGTWRNTERTGKRRVTRLSTIARSVPHVRHMDMDLIQWCPKCKRPQLFAEVKSSFVNKWEWEQTRKHASYYGHGCLAILVVEGKDVLGTVVYDSADDSFTTTPRAGEAYLTSVLERARDIHVCWLPLLQALQHLAPRRAQEEVQALWLSGRVTANGLGPASIVPAGRQGAMAARISAVTIKTATGDAVSEEKKVWVCPRGHPGKISIERPRCGICMGQMVEALWARAISRPARYAGRKGRPPRAGGKR